jgi:hypothetical protein
MAIKEFITLEGVQEVEAQLKKLAATGEQSLEQFRKPLPDIKLPDLDTKPVEEAGGHVVKLTEVLHTLRPVLQAAGIQFSEFGALTRLAGTSLIALAAATTGAVIVGLAKLEESIAATKGRLTDLFGTAGAGERAFNQLKEGTIGLGTNVEKLAPALEAAKTAVDRFIASSSKVKFTALPGVDLPTGTAQNLKNTGDAVLNFFKLLRAGRLDADEAAKADKAFFDTLKEGGLVTAAALKNLPTGTIQLLAEAMNRGKISAEQFIAEVALAPIPVNKLIEALARFGPQAQTAFDTKAIKGVDDALSGLLKSLQEAFQSASGKSFSEFIVQQLNGITQGIKTTVEEFSKLGAGIATLDKTFADVPGIKQFVAILNSITAAQNKFAASKPAAQLGPEFNEAFGFVPDPRQKEQIQAQFEQIGKDASGNFKKGWLEAPTTFTPQQILPTEEVSQAATEAGNQAGTNLGEGLKTGAETKVPEVLTITGALYEAIKAQFSTPIPINFDTRNPLQSTAPFASGGMVRGPGSGTSDSILAWLSNSEFVVSARAVSHYGADLFAALNAMRLPRDFIGGFSMGGLARAISGNRFAAGGSVSAGHPVVLNIDRHSFNMSAGGDTIAQLKRFAVTSQLSSTGRKPRWVK